MADARTCGTSSLESGATSSALPDAAPVTSRSCRQRVNGYIAVQYHCTHWPLARSRANQTERCRTQQKTRGENAAYVAEQLPLECHRLVVAQVRCTIGTMLCNAMQSNGAHRRATSARQSSRRQDRTVRLTARPPDRLSSQVGRNGTAQHGSGPVRTERNGVEREGTHR